MKNSSRLLILFFCHLAAGPAFAQKVQTIDWANNPFYPVPYPVVPNHFKMEGKVAKVKETWKSEIDNDNDMMSQEVEFNDKGFVSKITCLTNGEVKRTSNFKDSVNKQIPDLYKIIEYSEFNKKITRKEYSFWKNLPRMMEWPDYYAYYNHDSRGNLVSEEIERKDSNLYVYNETGQLISFTMYNRGEKTLYHNYSYSREKGNLVVKDFLMISLPKTIIHTFDERGNILKKEEEKGDIITTYEYVFDKRKNWILRDETIARISTGTKKVNTRYRTIQYAD